MPSKSELVDMIKESLLSDNDLSFLEELNEDGIRNLEKEISEYKKRIEEQQKPIFKTMAVTTKFLPNFMVAKLGQDMLTPYIAAQVTQFLEPKDSAALGRSFAANFLGEVTLYVEPELTSKIARHMRINEVVKIIHAMISKGLFIKLGELSDALDTKLVTELVPQLNSASDIARIMHNMQSIEKIQAVGQRLNSSLFSDVVEELKSLNNTTALGALE